MEVISPPYKRLYREGTLAGRHATSLNLMKQCELCPRQCGIDRLSGEIGFCRTGRWARVASYHAHFGEEAPLVGRYGSGTIFISHCNLLCSFCQNFEISHHGEGRKVTPEHLAAMMMQLQEVGCHNINFVTPTHVVPQIIEGLIIATEQGLTIPLVYNSGGYDKVETLTLLDGIIDIYMPDFKFSDAAWSRELCAAEDYFGVASTAIKEMHRQVGDLEISKDGIATRGLLIRHLVMPNGIADTETIMSFIAREISPRTYVNIMDQYHPCGHAARQGRINRRITPSEYADAIRTARDAGLTRLDSRPRLFR
jgi:putative pyruvate formate lyase activating enzyme